MSHWIVGSGTALLLCLGGLGYAAEHAVKSGETAPVGSKFGFSVGFADVDADGSDELVVGAPYASSSITLGEAVVYGAGPVSARPFPMVLAGEGNHGFAICGLGDADDDGKEEFAVSAVNGDGVGTGLSGSVTVYKGGKAWDRGYVSRNVVARLSGESPLDKFGFSLAGGDLNGDGLNDLVVGAPFHTPQPSVYQGGAVYLHFAPEFTTRIALRASAMNRGIGGSVAAGDINGDGLDDICMGAAGKVLCYYGSTAMAPAIDLPDAVFRSSAAGFGKALAVVGDLDGDEIGELVIGAPNAAVNGVAETGSLFIVKGAAGPRNLSLDAPSPGLLVRINGAAGYGRFGAAIAAGGDYYLAVGAPLSDSAKPMSGKAYLFRGTDISGSTTVADAELFSGQSADTGFGAALAFSGTGKLVVGAPRTGSDTGAAYLIDPDSGDMTAVERGTGK